MHLASRGYLFLALIALLGIAGLWSEQPGFEGAWLWPAGLMLLGLSAEAWYLRGTHLELRLERERLRLGRVSPAAFVFRHNRDRTLRLQYARALPAAFRQLGDVREIELPADEEARDGADLLPLRLGAGRLVDVPARLLGRFQLAWWSRRLPQDAAFRVAPDSLPRGGRGIAGESAGETPRRKPGVGMELLQLRDYTPGDALSRIDWKATARRGSLISREYSEAQHLELVLVIDAGRASRARAGALDRLGLYANVAARLAEHAVSVEDRVGLLVYAERMLVACPPDRGLRAVTRLRHALESLDSQRGEAQPQTAALAVRKLLHQRGLVVWLTDLAEPERNEHLLQALQTLLPRHQPVVASPRAVEIAQLAARTATDWRDPPMALAAREHARRAQLQIASLQRQGVVVIDESEELLDEAVLDAYLSLRRRRRI